MAQSVTMRGPVETAPRPRAAVQPRTIKPIKWFAVLGGMILALETYVISAWLLSGPERTPNGPDPVPGWMEFAAHAQEVLFPAVALATAYWFLVRPWWRTRRLGLDGMLVIVVSLMYWQDPLMNYAAPTVTYNTSFWVQFGAWSEQVPGWMSPNGRLFAENPLFGGATYPGWVFLGIVLGSAVMRKAKERWPHLGNVGLFMVGWGALLAVDLLFEIPWLYLGSYAFPGAIRGISVFPGTYHQGPVHEFLLWSFAWAAMAAVRYFRNDKGETIAERGVEDLRVGARTKSFVRLLALNGAVQGAMLFLYIVPFAWFSLHAGRWPADFDNRSYLRDGMCGAGTTYACPGPDIPINRPGSVHVGPDGSLVTTGTR